MNQPGTKLEHRKGVDPHVSFSGTDGSAAGSPARGIGSSNGDVAPYGENGKGSGASDISAAYFPVAEDLAKVEHLLRDELSSDTPWIDRLFEHNWIRGGKRIRPLMLLLSGGSSGTIHDGHIFSAAAIEMIHAATLVHDDVIDKADIRRHLPTVNARWGDRTSILLGDYLFTHAFQLASRSGSCSVVAEIASASSRVCSGEIRQNDWQGNLDLNEQDYLSMIGDKTGALCECSCRVGALLNKLGPSEVDEFGEYGKKLGVAFQIIDDVLDLVGLEATVGKTLGTDVINQKLTLPVIHSLANSSQSEQDELRDLFRNGCPEYNRILDLLQKTESIEYAREMARCQIDWAVQFASRMPPSPWSNGLRQLAEFVIMRMF